MTTMDCTGRLTEAVRNHIAEAMENVAIALAYDLGYESAYDEGAEDWYASDDDIRHAAREPVCAAAVLDDLARWLDMETPPLLASALEAPPPVEAIHLVPPV
jgi:hypothetical protein